MAHFKHHAADRGSIVLNDEGLMAFQTDRLNDAALLLGTADQTAHLGNFASLDALRQEKLSISKALQEEVRTKMPVVPDLPPGANDIISAYGFDISPLLERNRVS